MAEKRIGRPASVLSVDLEVKYLCLDINRIHWTQQCNKSISIRLGSSARCSLTSYLIIAVGAVGVQEADQISLKEFTKVGRRNIL